MLNRLVKYGIIGLAGLTTLGALLVIVFIVIRPEGEAWWMAARLAVAAYVVTMGVLIGLHLRAASTSTGRPQLLLLGAIGLLALGIGGAVWGFHMAEVTGDLEAWAILINLLMAVQGAATIWYLWKSEHPEVSVAIRMRNTHAPLPRIDEG